MDLDSAAVDVVGVDEVELDTGGAFPFVSLGFLRDLNAENWLMENSSSPIFALLVVFVCRSCCSSKTRLFRQRE